MTQRKSRVSSQILNLKLHSAHFEQERIITSNAHFDG